MPRRHLDDGAYGPPLTGDAFRQKWGSRPLDGLMTYTTDRMPPTQPGRLGEVRYAQVITFVLQENGVRPGANELPSDPTVVASMPPPSWAPVGGGRLAPSASIPPPPSRANALDTLRSVTETMLTKPTDGEWLLWRRTYDASGFGFQYNARPQYQDQNDQNRYVQRFSATYVTGSHNFKTGFQLQQGVLRQHSMTNQDLRYTFTRGVPTSLDQLATPYPFLANTRAELGVFAQDQWALRRLTLSLGVRFDYFNGYVPPQDIPAGRFIGARSGEVDDVPNWKDINARIGGSYDVFGKGRTAVKASIGRYVGKMSTAVATANNPINTSINTVNRSWSDANGNYIPDCDLKNFDANGECGPISNRFFGQQNPNAVTYADDLIRGWGTRDYLWDLSTEVQHQLSSRVSVKGGWYRNWTTQFGDLFTNPGTNLANGGWPTGVTDNLAVTSVDFRPYCITAPTHPDLPGGGGYQVCGLYDIVPAKFGQGQQVVTRASNFGGKSRVSNFFNGSISTRLGAGRELGASIDTGRIVEDNCYVVDSPQQLLFCHVVAPFTSQTQLKAYWSLPLPAQFAVSGVVQNLAGIQRLATYAAPNSIIAPSLGRNLAACGTRTVCTATATVPLIAPMSEFEPRRTQLDLRLTKQFKLSGRATLRGNLDLYNVLNDGSVVNPNINFGPSWLQPTGGFFTGGLTDGRLLQFSSQLTF